MCVWSNSSFSSIGKIVWHSSISIHCKSVQRAPSYQPEIMQRTEWSDDGRPDLSLYAGEFAKIWGMSPSPLKKTLNRFEEQPKKTKQMKTKLWIHMYCKFNILPEYLLLLITQKYRLYTFFYISGTRTIIMISMRFIPFVFIYFQELAQMYKTTERSVEDSANLVGLKLPKLSN